MRADNGKQTRCPPHLHHPTATQPPSALLRITGTARSRTHHWWYIRRTALWNQAKQKGKPNPPIPAIKSKELLRETLQKQICRRALLKGKNDKKGEPIKPIHDADQLELLDPESNGGWDDRRTRLCSRVRRVGGITMGRGRCHSNDVLNRCFC